MRPRAALVLAILGTLGGRAAAAQAPAASLEVIPVQGLSFGPLIPGVPETVAVGDAARRGELLLRGRGVFDLTLVLPTALVSPSGARIPLRFAAKDGAVLRSSAHALIPFNPLEPNRVRVQDNQGPTRLVFGGTALPATDQPAGRYQATVVVVVNNPGT